MFHETVKPAIQSATTAVMDHNASRRHTCEPHARAPLNLLHSYVSSVPRV